MEIVLLGASRYVVTGFNENEPLLKGRIYSVPKGLGDTLLSRSYLDAAMNRQPMFIEAKELEKRKALAEDAKTRRRRRKSEIDAELPEDAVIAVKPNQVVEGPTNVDMPNI